MTASGRHAFWSAPRFSYPVLRTQPMLAGGRFVGMGAGPFLGEAPASGLDSLTVSAIMNRAAASPLAQAYTAAYEAVRGAHSARNSGPVPEPWSHIFQLRAPALPQLTPNEIATIQALAQDPSSEVLDELQLIDGFFGVAPGSNDFYGQAPFTVELCNALNGRGRGGWMGRGVQQISAAQAVAAWAGYKPSGRGAFGGGFRQGDGPTPSDLAEAVRANPFYCGTPRSFPEVVYGLSKNDYAGWFGIDPNQTWGQAKLQVHNALTVMDVVSGYPFPPPVDISKAAPFWIMSIGDIQEIVRTPAPVDPEVVRYWVTMQVLANYSAWSDRIAADQKKKAKKAKRKAIMTAVAIAVAGIVASFLLPAIIALVVTAVKTAVTAYIEAEKRKKAAKEMAEAAKMFEADAPAFAKEVDHAANLLDEQAAKIAAAQPPSPELQAAIQEVKDETGPGLGTILPVGGGIAAAGLAAFLIFK